MALISCYECGKQISDAAPSCPTCGAPKKKAQSLEEAPFGKTVAEMLNERKCPICGGVLMSMGGVEGLFRGGIAGVAKKHRCNSCGHLV